MNEFSTRLTQLHIDVARNSTDDFNLFHDKSNWHQIKGNPFGGPIALGFQLSCFIEDCCKQYRQAQNETGLIDECALIYSNYQLSFANAVKAGESLRLSLKASKFKTEQKQLSNRLLLKSEQGIAILGFKSESQVPAFTSELTPEHIQELDELSDRSVTRDGNFFYKRKFTTNSNAKNFLIGSGVEQAKYFDELNDRIRFPESYCSGLISCALLESASKCGHDFTQNPMVYTSHNLSINRQLVTNLRSDQVLHFLVSHQADNTDKTGQITNQCCVLNQDKKVLIQGNVALAPLSMLLTKSKNSAT